jgi:Sugar (pentulose and hexulose) kinases
MAYLIGADIGTSGTKCVLFDEAGNTVSSALSEYGLSQPKTDGQNKIRLIGGTPFARRSPP